MVYDKIEEFYVNVCIIGGGYLNLLYFWAFKVLTLTI